MTASRPCWAEPPLTATEFDDIRRLAYNHFGLDLKQGKQSLVFARLSKELRRYGFTSFQQYCHHVEADRTGEALARLADALTTNFTTFLREPAHFECLKTDIVPALIGHPAAIWS